LRAGHHLEGIDLDDDPEMKDPVGVSSSPVDLN
jgi:hypothetical protein